MVERVAAAIAAAKRAGYFTTGSDGMTMERHLARAAIEAMREPTAAMVDAGYDANNGEDRNLGALGAKEAWQLMIGAALK